MIKDYKMDEITLHNVEISEKFLKHINKITKMSIKVYLSLIYLKYKRGNSFYASHSEVSINVFDDNNNSFYPKWFGIRTKGNTSKHLNSLKNLTSSSYIEARQRTVSQM